MSARLLVVDDTPSLRALLQLCLTRAGYAVDMAEEGLAAVEMFSARSYDAVIMDIQMPVMDGLAAVAAMREREREGNRAPAPILALTANTEPAELRRCLEAGFTGTVRKPFGRAELLAAVAGHIGAGPAAPICPDIAGDRIVVSADPELADLIGPFLDNCRRENAAMKSALERRDFPAIAAVSHRLTGSGASFGFPVLSDESRLIETAAKAADGAGVSAHLDEMRRYLERVSVVYP